MSFLEHYNNRVIGLTSDDVVMYARMKYLEGFKKQICTDEEIDLIMSLVNLNEIYRFATTIDHGVRTIVPRNGSTDRDVAQIGILVYDQYSWIFYCFIEEGRIYGMLMVATIDSEGVLDKNMSGIFEIPSMVNKN